MRGGCGAETRLRRRRRRRAQRARVGVRLRACFPFLLVCLCVGALSVWVSLRLARSRRRGRGRGGARGLQADVYSFGIILWECIARKIPYTDMNQMQIAVAVATQATPLTPHRRGRRAAAWRRGGGRGWSREDLVRARARAYGGRRGRKPGGEADIGTPIP